MKVAESRFTAPGVSFVLHAGTLLTVLLLGRSPVPFVPPPYHPPVILVAPPRDAPIIVRHQRLPVAPTPVQKISSGAFDDIAKPAAPAPSQPAPSRVSTGGLPNAVDPSPNSSWTMGKIISGVLGGGASGPGSPGPRSGATLAGGGGASGVDELPRMVSSPRATYTEEALRLKIRGSVVLRVLLTCYGKVQVLGVVTPLGHGLDQSAREAAEAMEFTPARKLGKPVDYITTLSIVFDLS
jgi:TonB family protein